MDQRLSDLGIQPKYQAKNLKSFSSSSVTRKVLLKYINNLEDNFKKGIGLFISGKTVCGKSILANVIAMVADAFGFSVRVMNMRELTEARLSPTSDFTEFLTVEFLVVDGIRLSTRDGRKYINEGMQVAMHDLVKERDGKLLPIIMATRLDLADSDDSIEEFFGDGISDLLKTNSIRVQCIRNQKLIDKAARRVSR